MLNVALVEPLTRKAPVTFKGRLFPRRSNPAAAPRPAPPQKPAHKVEQLILANREAAQRMGFSLLRRWNARLEREEVISIIDLALARAARRYRSDMGSQFLSFSYFFVKAAIVDEIARRKRNQETPCDTILDDTEKAAMSEIGMGQPACPENSFFSSERRDLIAAAVTTLPEIERDIILRSFVMDQEVTSIARELGYSRGHVSRLKQRALAKIRVRIEARGLIAA